MSNRPRRQLGGYEILYALKSGGMGEVLLARRRGARGFERLVAVKTIRSEYRDYAPLRTMFLDEAKLLARLSHPGIAQVYDFGEEDEVLFLAMEYVAGVRFRELVDRGAPPAIAAQAMAAACRALHSAHEATDLSGRPLEVVHRDVSPENLMMTFEGQIKVLDFGIALMRGREAPATEFGAIKGKPPYLAPEQVKNEPVDRRTDVFAASSVLFELLTGERAFDGDSVYAVARAIEVDDVPAPSEIVGPLPAGLDQVVLRGLQKQPDDRFPTASAMARELEQVARRSGGEMLEQFAGRALAAEREAHRAWLEELLGRAEAEPAAGRASGVLTAAALSATQPGAAVSAPAAGDAGAAEATAPVHPAPAAAPDTGDQGAAAARTTGERAAAAAAVTDAGAAHPAPGSRRAGKRALAVVAVVAAIGLAAAGRRVLRGSGGAADAGTPAHSVSAAVDAGAARAAPAAAIHAMGDAAPVRADGGRPDSGQVSGPSARAARRRHRGSHRRTHRRRSRRARHAGHHAAAAASASAARRAGGSGGGHSEPAAAAAGEVGYVTVAATPYALVRIDGSNAGTTPIIRRKLPVGRHEVVLSSPDSGRVRLRKTVEIRAGQVSSVIAR